jgi:hypothetical protein
MVNRDSIIRALEQDDSARRKRVLIRKVKARAIKYLVARHGEEYLALVNKALGEIREELEKSKENP